MTLDKLLNQLRYSFFIFNRELIIYYKVFVMIKQDDTKFLCWLTWADPGFMEPEAYINWGILFKKNNTKLGNQNWHGNDIYLE